MHHLLWGINLIWFSTFFVSLFLSLALSHFIHDVNLQNSKKCHNSFWTFLFATIVLSVILMWSGFAWLIATLLCYACVCLRAYKCKLFFESKGLNQLYGCCRTIKPMTRWTTIKLTPRHKSVCSAAYARSTHISKKEWKKERNKRLETPIKRENNNQ